MKNENRSQRSEVRTAATETEGQLVRRSLGEGGRSERQKDGARDEEWGTAAVAFVDASADVPLDGLRALLATQLARHEIPRVVLPWPAEFRDVLKPSRAAMQALAESQWAH